MFSIAKSIGKPIGKQVHIVPNLSHLPPPDIPEGAIMNKSGTLPILTLFGDFIIIKSTIPENAIMSGDNYIMTMLNEYITT